jgi:hypothetical protein
MENPLIFIGLGALIVLIGLLVFIKLKEGSDSAPQA